MAKKTDLMASTGLLSLAVGLFLFLSGILNLVDSQSLAGKVAGLFADNNTKVVNLVAAILKIASGAVLLVGPFGLLTDVIRKLAFWIVIGFWVALTLWLAFTTVGAFQGDAKAVLVWFQSLSLNVAVLAALWQLKPEGK